MAGWGTQRCRQIEIALTVRRIDIARAAPAVAAVDPEDGIADADVGADPIEFLPWSGAEFARNRNASITAPAHFQAAHGWRG